MKYANSIFDTRTETTLAPLLEAHPLVLDVRYEEVMDVFHDISQHYANRISEYLDQDIIVTILDAYYTPDMQYTDGSIQGTMEFDMLVEGATTNRFSCYLDVTSFDEGGLDLSSPFVAEVVYAVAR